MTVMEDTAEANDRTPLLSVTVLNYNYAHYLPQCLDSILSQTFTDFELILINDCSTDNSREVIQPYLADPRVRLVDHKENKGFVASLIEGADLSRGKYITVISADDYCVSSQAFATILRPLEADDEVVFAYSTPGWFTDDGICQLIVRSHKESYVRSGMEEFHDIVVPSHLINHSGTVIRTSAYHAVGGYDSSLRYAVDNVMWLVLCSQGKVAYCDAPLFAYRQHGANMSKSRLGFRIGLREHMQGIENAFAMQRSALSIDYKQCSDAMQRHLLSSATTEVFGGRLRDGWYAYWCALCISPVSTAIQIRTLALLARTIFGQHLYDTIRSTLRPKLLCLREKRQGM